MIFCKKKKAPLAIGTRVMYRFRDGVKNTISKRKDGYGCYFQVTNYKIDEDRVHKISSIAQKSYGSYLYKVCDKWYSEDSLSVIIK